MSFKPYLLEEVAAPIRNAIVGGPFGSNLVSKDYVDEGVPVIRGQNMGGKWVKGPFAFVSTSKAEQLSQNKARPGDLVFTQRGTLGQVSIVPNEPYLEYVVSQSQMKITLNSELADVDFIYYLFRSDGQVRYILNSAIQTGVPHTNLGILKKTPVFIPSINTQKEIAGILSALDERIDLLNQTNATLEAIAQALFKSWFVDFDPVHAKAEGRQPEGMDATTAALFPDSFEESELGLVPKGWGIECVADVAEIIKGKSYKSTELAKKHHTALVTLKSFARGGGFRLDGFKPYTGNYKSNQIVFPGDLIVAYTDVTQAAELIGKPAIVVGVEDYQTLIASLDVGIVRPNLEKVTRQYLYGLFRTELFQSHTYSHTSGTTVLHLAKESVGSYSFPYPPYQLIRSFSEVADALSERSQSNIDQIRTLTQLRDTLLPRLISGQLRLPEAESLLESAL
ncbi:restriction endonuclease subunit S [Pseudomonas luteola]|uniref:Restriction endonuclease subunit S n=1 Tax=Pseudomonas luteola TaxID=47886 RepID=A0ABS0MTM8_PSELU|nr:restriction endonuclease subunit S [Pseudomonas luteola]MBH3440080.1 restriction endonuclease subunit S [Pseudomonas luteola]